MIPNELKQPFTTSGVFAARRPFAFNGRKYNVGDAFPWRRITCPVRRVRQMYESGHLTLTVNGVEAEDQAPVEEAEEFRQTTFVYDPQVHEIDNPSRGIWVIKDDDGKVRAVINRKIAKKLDNREEPVEIDLP